MAKPVATAHGNKDWVKRQKLGVSRAKHSALPKASIVIPAYNNAKVLRRVLKAMLELDYPNDFEVIVVNDGSTDGTKEMLEREFGREKKIRAINFGKNQGVCRARNAGIAKAKYEIIVNMDHDCIPAKDWLSSMVSGFDSEKVGVVSAFGDFGGTSTAFRANLLRKVGGYDEEYRYYREDTDLTFKIMELGYEYRQVRADYVHDHEMAKPRGLGTMARLLLQRLKYHMNDVLLYKKHPKLAAQFLDVRLGFIVNPAKDFRAATNLWPGSSSKMKLCSPRGIIVIENKSVFHAALIIILGICYVIAVKAFRLAGSIKYGKLLI
jgi:cellulose synthase/poly-beta-1,6-N-acetylglucosamine synthase-like glycosyltransferase